MEVWALLYLMVSLLCHLYCAFLRSCERNLLAIMALSWCYFQPWLYFHAACGNTHILSVQSLSGFPSHAVSECLQNVNVSSKHQLGIARHPWDLLANVPGRWSGLRMDQSSHLWILLTLHPWPTYCNSRCSWCRPKCLPSRRWSCGRLNLPCQRH